jgi:predicted MPP superfamily phosphohydrolase
MVMALALFDILKLCHLPFRYPFLTSLLLTLSLLTYGFYQYWHPVIHTVDLKFDKKVACTNDSLKIVMVSDLHLGMGTAETLLQKYVSMINEQQPDLILICGDLIDNSIVPVKEKQMSKTLAQLNAKMGIYMAPGNHEYISGINECVKFLQQTNVQLLKDSVVTLPNGVRLAGRDDRSNPHRKSLAQLLENEHDNILIVMDHQPNELQQAADNGVDLLLCGHTHHGQIWPLSTLTNKLFEVSHGYAKKGNTHIYVSSGLALWGPPFRIGTHSELTVFNVSWIK